jgi:hypothetical protein
MTGRVARGWAILLVMLVTGMTTTAHAQSQAGLEYAVKANYLVRFAAFVDWPVSAFSTGTSPVVVCVVGRDPFGPTLEQAVTGQVAHSRRIVVRRPQSASEAMACHILYAAPDAGAAYLTDAPGRLVVTEASRGRAGAIAFVIRDGRVRFHIDQSAARRSGLTMSSRLLDLALTVRGR